MKNEDVEIVVEGQSMENGYGTALEGESFLAFGYFCRYCDLGFKRTLELLSKVDDIDGKTRSPSALGEWSQKFNWLERAARHDAIIVAQQFKEKSKQLTMRFSALVSELADWQMSEIQELTRLAVKIRKQTEAEGASGVKNLVGVYRAIGMFFDSLMESPGLNVPKKDK